LEKFDEASEVCIRSKRVVVKRLDALAKFLDVFNIRNWARVSEGSLCLRGGNLLSRAGDGPEACMDIAYSLHVFSGQSDAKEHGNEPYL
jgi:hypothetical protein